MNLELLKLYALTFVGINYKWGGDDPMQGFDCSGFVQELLEAAGIDPLGDQTAQGLYNYFITVSGTTNKELGALAFYGKSTDRITHIAFCLDNKLMIEAGGGGSRTIDIQSAASHNAYIRIRPIDKRKDLVACLMPRY